MNYAREIITAIKKDLDQIENYDNIPEGELNNIRLKVKDFVKEVREINKYVFEDIKIFYDELSRKALKDIKAIYKRKSLDNLSCIQVLRRYYVRSLNNTIYIITVWMPESLVLMAVNQATYKKMSEKLINAGMGYAILTKYTDELDRTTERYFFDVEKKQEFYNTMNEKYDLFCKSFQLYSEYKELYRKLCRRSCYPDATKEKNMLLASIITLFHNLDILDGLDKNTYIYQDQKSAEELGNKNGMFQVFSSGKSNGKQKEERIIKFYNLHKKYILVFSNLEVSEYRMTFSDRKVKSIEEYTIYQIDAKTTNSDIILDFAEYFQAYYEKAIEESKKIKKTEKPKEKEEL